MRHAIIATACLALSATAAQAQSVISADNPVLSVFTAPMNGPYKLDGTNTALSFRTNKANEVVQLGFSGFCGFEALATTGQPPAQTANYVQMFFLVDGIVLGENGNANMLCSWNATTSTNLQFVGNGVTAQQHFNVATPGVHTIAVQVQAPVNYDGSQIVSVLGQTHLNVGR